MMLLFRLTFIIASCFPFIYAILEDDILYDIKWYPGSSSLIEHSNDFIVTSKRKEKYSCTLPDPQKHDARPIDSIVFSEIEPLLEKLHAEKICAYQFDPYWSYELCHGVHVRQYHESKTADKKTTVQEYFLGYYNADNQDIIINSDSQQAIKIHHKTIHHRAIPTFPIRYADGTLCDINSNKPRETIVYYACYGDGDNGIIHLQEVSSCEYEVIVSSSWVCELPGFSVEESSRHEINCIPQDSAPKKPRNLKRLEHAHLASSRSGDGGQFTVTNADGTTFIITYRYVNEGEHNDASDATNTNLLDEANTNLPDATVTPEPPGTGETSSTKDVREFLENFFSGQICLTAGTGWWQYEICYGRHVTQFHEEQEKRTEILLGSWDYEKHVQLAITNTKKKTTGDKKERGYISLYYTNGDKCELTGKPRIVEVKLRCSKKDKKSHLPLMYLVEPENCSYILGLESYIFCDMANYTDENGVPDGEKFLQSFQNQ